MYASDSLAICKQLRTHIKKHEGFFYSKEFSDTTELSVDTIIYDKTSKKMAILIIAKNPTSKQLVPDKLHQWYFGGTCYLGCKRKNEIDLCGIGPNFTNSPSEQGLSKDLRECFFCELGLLGEKTKKAIYNINDVRFWQSTDWNECFPNKE